MSVKIIKIGETKYEFVNDTYYDNESWGHITALYKNDVLICKDKVRYYNRTWEVYQYQTIMKLCIDKHIDILWKKFKKEFKENHGLKVLKGENKETAKKLFKEIIEVKELRELYNKINYEI